MVNLKDIVATILNDMALARVQTDVESLRMAEIYSKDDFLKNMSIPRMRLKDFSLTLPIAIDKIDEQRLTESGKALTSEEASNQAYKTLTEVLSKRNINLSRGDVQIVKSSLKSRTDTLAKNKSWKMKQVKPLSDDIGKLMDVHIQKTAARRLDADEIKKVKDEFRADLRSALLTVRPPLPNLEVMVNTASLQNMSEKEKLVHITLNVDEMGLEWSVYESSSGETRERLVPE